MAKVIISAQKQTAQIIEKLKDNVGGIELLGYTTASEVKKGMLSAGRVTKVIIFEAALDLDEIDFLAEQPSITTILVMKTEEKMKKLDIKYFIKENVKIINFADKSLNLLFIKNLVTKPVDKSLLYNNQLHKKVEPVQDIKPLNEEDNGPVLLKRNVRSEDEESETVEPIAPPANERPKLTSLIKPKREVNLKREEETVTPIIQAYEDSKDKIKRTVDLFRDGCIVGVIGLPKSYSSTTTLNMARSTAEADLTTLVIDTDYVNLPFSAMTMNLFKFYQENQKDDFIMEALRGNAIFKNTCLYDTNLHILSNSLISDPLDTTIDKIKNMRRDLINKIKKLYKIIFIDIRCEDLLANKDNLRICNRIVFNVPMTEKDLLYLMRHVETLEPDLIKRVFESNYIAVNQENRNLLLTKYNDLRALDDFLEKNYAIINKEKYGNIERVGEVVKEKNPINYMDKDKKVNGDYYRQILMNILE